MRGFWAAWRFLTIIPLPGKLGTDEAALAGSLPFFPLVGLCLGAGMMLWAWLAWHFFPPLVASVLLTLALLAVSGGFHLDGLADSADGFFSARPRERVLEIMRDSRIGVMGVIAVVMVILLKVTAMAGMTPQRAMLAAFLMPLAGRCLMVVKMALLPYIREKGAASLFYAEPAKLRRLALWSGILLYSAAWYAGGLIALGGLAAAVLSLLLLALYCRVKIGGATGDTLGACCELVETAVALALAIKI